ncbi:LytR/AlgR family response regulator transcription factor [Peptacetobacter sp.]|uniref:LytR/AlgR family response regulator transcription factor n=1 Tax=Peptacetobacter sp. TaxID=2991975 RepID=UPI00261C4D4A|nr:LytTR family DNA-binding domain-containing protein [Peptacetobacter sp.]
MLNISICEDENIQALYLESLIKEHLDNLKIEYNINLFNSGEELIKKYNKYTDILFLDIKMRGLSGMDTAKEIRKFDENIEIIFTTALQEYVFEAYEVKAFRYLLKPIDKNLLFNYLDLCIKEINHKNKKICLKYKSNLLILNLDDILYAEVIQKNTTIYTKDNSYSLKMSLKDLETTINSSSFFKCHNSYLVNMDKVNSINPNFVTIGKYTIPISRPRYKEFKTRLTSYLCDSLF